jgi:hypothetical protein
MKSSFPISRAPFPPLYTSLGLQRRPKAKRPIGRVVLSEPGLYQFRGIIVGPSLLFVNPPLRGVMRHGPRKEQDIPVSGN